VSLENRNWKFENRKSKDKGEERFDAEDAEKRRAHAGMPVPHASGRLVRGQESVVAGRGESEFAEGALVDADYVGVPEGNIGQVFGYDFLDLAG
jgi:hypothetical protein